MILEAFACSVFSLTEFTKTQHYSLEENTKEKIVEQGLYHFTSKDVADRIVKDGFFKPTKGFVANHMGKDKVYMFAGLPDMDNFSKNLPAKLNPFVSGNLEFNAVRLNPNEQELSKFKERLQDSAVVYEGRYDISSGRANAVELVVDLDKNGKCIFREKTEQELENGYMPSAELLEYIEKHKTNKITNDFKVLYKEVKAGLSSIPSAIPRFYRDFKSRSERKKEIKEFEPYSVDMSVLNGEKESSYHISCDRLEFYGDKKLNRVNIQKTDIDTGELTSYECYMDNHILNLGYEAAAIYLSKLEDIKDKRILNEINGINYVGQPMLDVKNNDISIGVDAKFNELLRERNFANFIGETRERSYNLLDKKVKEYYKRHPIRKFLDKRAMKKGEIKMLTDRNEIGKYTNEKLKKFDMYDAYQTQEENNGFELNKRCGFEYKNGSKYSALIGETVEIDGKILRKLIVSEESNYLTENNMDTVKLPQNYYIDDIDFEEIDKKDLAQYLASLDYDKKEDALIVEESGFVGNYVGGVTLNKKGRICDKTYDKSLKEKYGKEIHIQKEKPVLDMSDFTYDEQATSQNYYEQVKEKNRYNQKEQQEKTEEYLDIE